MYMALGYGETLLRLLCAVAIGWLFGLERTHRQKPVGVRTHILICLGCTIVSMVSAYGLDYASGASDPARLMVGIWTGIGFIGAGIIWKSPSGSVQGITTAAEIFLLAALGITVGLGHYFIAFTSTVIGVLTLESNRWAALWKFRHVPEDDEDSEPPQDGKQTEEA